VAIDKNRSPSVGSLALLGNAVTLSFEFVGGSPGDGTLIQNLDATTDVPTNYEACDLTNFRQMPGSLKLTWRKYAVRQKSFDERHPQEFIKYPTNEKRKGSKRPEQDDRFIEDIGEVTPDDL
jgi:hypothetical protein